MSSLMNGITHRLRVQIGQNKVSMELAAKWMALRTSWEFKLVQTTSVSNSQPMEWHYTPSASAEYSGSSRVRCWQRRQFPSCKYLDRTFWPGTVARRIGWRFMSKTSQLNRSPKDPPIDRGLPLISLQAIPKITKRTLVFSPSLLKPCLCQYSTHDDGHATSHGAVPPLLISQLEIFSTVVNGKNKSTNIHIFQ